MDILWKTICFGPLQIGVKGQAFRQNLRRNAPGDCLTSCWAQKQDRTVKPTNWSERCIQTLSKAVTTGILVVLQFEQVGSWQKTCSLIAGRTLTLGCVVVDAESFFSFPLYTIFFSRETLYTYNYTYNYTYLYIYYIYIQTHSCVYTISYPHCIPIPNLVDLRKSDREQISSKRRPKRTWSGAELFQDTMAISWGDEEWYIYMKH